MTGNPPRDHWLNDDDARKAFHAKAAALGIGDEDKHFALGVAESSFEFEGSIEDATLLLEKYAAERIQHEQQKRLASLPEAPASINFFAVTSKGYNIQVTLRDFSTPLLVGRLAEVLEHAVLPVLARGAAGLAEAVDARVGLDLDDVQVARPSTGSS